MPKTLKDEHLASDVVTVRAHDNQILLQLRAIALRNPQLSHAAPISSVLLRPCGPVRSVVRG
jgi:hypothetical protein